MHIKTEDGVTVTRQGEEKYSELLFNYYDRTPGRIVWDSLDAQGWFAFRQLRTEHASTTAMLNGERVCTVAHAQSMGWWTPDHEAYASQEVS